MLYATFKYGKVVLVNYLGRHPSKETTLLKGKFSFQMASKRHWDRLRPFVCLFVLIVVCICCMYLFVCLKVKRHSASATASGTGSLSLRAAVCQSIVIKNRKALEFLNS